MRLTISQAHVLGPALRLVGETVLDEQTSGIMLHHPGLAVPNHILVDGRPGSARVETEQDGRRAAFDMSFPVDALAGGMDKLGFLRLRADGGIEPVPHSIAQIVFTGMQPGGVNHAHMMKKLDSLQRTRPSVSEMLTRFESLGDNCEFGMFAKALGNRRPSLLGYGGTGEWMQEPRRPALHLSNALLAELQGLGEPGDLTFEQHAGEWISRSRRFDFVFHSGLFDSGLRPDELAQREGRRLQFVKRKFLQDLANPWKILVRRSGGFETEAAMRQLRTAMSWTGQAWLLWVDAASEAEPATTVTLLDDRLLRVTHPALRGYEQADDPDLSAWSHAIEATFLVAELVAPGWAPQPITSRVGYDQILAG